MVPHIEAKVLREAAGQYPHKQIRLIFNDLSDKKIEHLKSILPKEKENFKISLHNKDGNELLRELGKHLYKLKNTHILLVYDPYNASIDWEAILPFLNTWGEVKINHQVLDSIRSIGIVKNPNKIKNMKEHIKRQ